ncbi:flavin reductase family protein [Streptomyces sp. NPDC006872]|uniref:flavin reductase family protein n=1 Tax=Streptomyces sp. NPDC006872 TaxID=3155720 RepID=UPI0033E2634C
MTLRQAFAHYPSGVAALAATVDGEDHVLVASSFTVGVSLDPALVLFAVQRTSTTWPLLRRASRIGISVLSQEQGELCRRLADKNRSTRWNGVAVDRRESGALIVEASSLSFECTIHAEHPAGDHEVVVLEIASFAADSRLDPLVFHGSRFRAIA